MNIEHLRTLVGIAENGSFSATARAKHVSQPAITKQVQRMESELGLSLLVRGARRQLSLTTAGERVLAFARDTLGRFEALERELAVLKTVERGTLVVAASTIPGEYLLPKLLTGFRVAYPQIQVEVTISDTSDVAERLLEDESDVGVIGSAVQGSGLVLERLVSDEVVLVVPPEHAVAK
jgi:DNA-binding transcriptional LysR family regulator